eukprot:PhF_6_TR27877/c0_g1_i2/m.40794
MEGIVLPVVPIPTQFEHQLRHIQGALFHFLNIVMKCEPTGTWKERILILSNKALYFIQPSEPKKSTQMHCGAACGGSCCGGRKCERSVEVTELGGYCRPYRVRRRAAVSQPYCDSRLHHGHTCVAYKVHF